MLPEFRTIASNIRETMLFCIASIHRRVLTNLSICMSICVTLFRMHWPTDTSLKLIELCASWWQSYFRAQLLIRSCGEHWWRNWANKHNSEGWKRKAWCRQSLYEMAPKYRVSICSLLYLSSVTAFHRLTNVKHYPSTHDMPACIRSFSNVIDSSICCLWSPNLV